jgi:hypothetical protein
MNVRVRTYTYGATLDHDSTSNTSFNYRFRSCVRAELNKRKTFSYIY